MGRRGRCGPAAGAPRRGAARRARRCAAPLAAPAARRAASSGRGPRACGAPLLPRPPHARANGARWAAAAAAGEWDASPPLQPPRCPRAHPRALPSPSPPPPPRRRFLARPYGRVDRPRLKRKLLERCVAAGVRFLTDKVDSVSHAGGRSTVTTASGAAVRGSLVLDATGHSRRLVKFDQKFDPGYQGAYGIVAEVESHPFDIDTMLFMDWRDNHLAGTPELAERNAKLPTFLYAMPFSKTKCAAPRRARPAAASPMRSQAVIPRRSESRVPHPLLGPLPPTPSPSCPPTPQTPTPHPPGSSLRRRRWWRAPRWALRTSRRASRSASSGWASRWGPAARRGGVEGAVRRGLAAAAAGTTCRLPQLPQPARRGRPAARQTSQLSLPKLPLPPPPLPRPQVKSIEEEEYCLIPMGGVLPTHPQRVLGVGGTAGMVHPATGFMVSRMLGVAPTIADSIIDQLARPRDAGAAAAAAGGGGGGAASPGPQSEAQAEAMSAAVWRAAWPVERLRQRAFFCFGMDVLLRLNLAETRQFFNAFFSLSDFHWHGFLSARLGFAQLIGGRRRRRPPACPSLPACPARPARLLACPPARSPPAPPPRP
jgi:hypothetical protein